MLRRINFPKVFPNAAYLRKWVPIGVFLGIVAGVGSILFSIILSLSTKLLLGIGAGYFPPIPAGEGEPIVLPILRRWVIPFIAALGGLLCGLIVYKFAPETEGHGTDAAIDAFHNKKGIIRGRVPLIKMIASAITIGSGGSAGREGPIAQISAGFGSFLGKVLKLNPRERRIAVAAGIGAGIGSIFKAPFGGALLSAEILYRGDFEVDAIIPSFVASTVGYSIYGVWSGWTPIFGRGIHIVFREPFHLFYFALLGVACGAVGILYVKVFYSTRRLFQSLKIPNFLKPALGGLAVGTMGMFLPQILGTGYGWLQFIINGDFSILPLYLLFILLLAKIWATALSIGSGGSGGVFAPGLFIGGSVGGIIWHIVHLISPESNLPPSGFVVVGMMSLFGGVAKAPISVILMVTEMTGTYQFLVPSMIATVISFLVSGRKNSIYESQVTSRLESPAHLGEYRVSLLKRLKVKDAYNPNVKVLRASTRICDLVELVSTGENYGGTFPVVDEKGELVGVVLPEDIMFAFAHRDELEDIVVVGDLAHPVRPIFLDEDLHSALQKMVFSDFEALPVVERREPKKVVGHLWRADILKAYTSKE